MQKKISGIKFSRKIQKQLSKRGWTVKSIKDTIKNPHRTVATRDRRHLPGGGREDDPATAYINTDESYVVINDNTLEIIQVSNRHDPNWKLPF